MNETLKRALSGAVYVVLLLGCISYSREGLAILFGAPAPALLCRADQSARQSCSL